MLGLNAAPVRCRCLLQRKHNILIDIANNEIRCDKSPVLDRRCIRIGNAINASIARRGERVALDLRTFRISCEEKLFRSLVMLEEEKPISQLDVLNAMEKRRIIASYRAGGNRPQAPLQHDQRLS